MPRASRPRAPSTKLKAARRGHVTGTDMPPTAGAPPAVPPIQTRSDQHAVAPAALVDRYPTILGTSLTATYLSSVFRLALIGYRQQFVDLLGELLDLDPHLFSVVEKRVLSSANGHLEFKSFRLPPGHKDTELAQKAADMVQAEVDRIPFLTQSLASLLWGIYYGITAAEIFWTRDSLGWHIDRLDFVHSRRLSYPDMQSWSLHVWDQGQVLGWQSFGESPTNNALFGTCIADWPGKFIVFAPQLRGDYPTREGIGRQVAIWSLFKRAGVRGAMGYLERFAKGFLDGTYSTTDGGKPRTATDNDIAKLEAALRDVGPNPAGYVMHPDSTTITPKGYEGTGTAKITYQEFIDLCDTQSSKAALGGTLSTDHKGSGGLGGSGTAEVQERGEVDLEQYDATCLAESIRSSMVYWLVRMNMPEALHVLPACFLNVDREPDAGTILKNATSMTKIGGRVDLDKVSDQTGIPLIPAEEDEDGEVKPRGSFNTDVVDPTVVLDDLKSDEAKQQDQDAADAAQELAKAKATQPVVQAGALGAPGAGGNGQQGKPGKSAKGAKPKPTKATMRLVRDEADGAPELRAIMLSARPDKHAARYVFEQCLKDYPASALAWIIPLQWDGPELVPVEDIDFSKQDTWRASKEPNEPYQEHIQEGRMKPIILVKAPDKAKLDIVDGHHRGLAYKTLGRPALAYVAKVPTAKGPWAEMHAAQLRGSSKGSWNTEDEAPPSGQAALTLDARPNPRLRAAAIGVLIDDQGRILTVSRPEPPNEQAFPGGMLDDGETIEETCARELHEETGLEVAREPDGTPIVEPLFITTSPTDGRDVHVYRVPRWTGDAYAAESATTVEWMTVGALFAQSVLFRDIVRELMARKLLTRQTEAAAQ